MKMAVIVGLALASAPGMVLAQSFKVIDRETGEAFGPFDTSSDSSIIISGRSYYIVPDGERAEAASPEDILKLYLMTSNWPDRIQYVVKSEGIVDRMRAYYTSPVVKPDDVSIVSVGEKYNGEEDTIILMGTREFRRVGLPPSMTTSYVMRSVDGDWLVDWDETDNLIKAEDEEKARVAAATLGLSDAKVEISTLNFRNRSNFTRVEASIKNMSDAEISMMSISFSLYDGDGGYISQGYIHHSGIKPGAEVVVNGSAETGKNTASTVKYQVSSIDIYTQNGSVQRGVQQYFELVEK